MPYKDKEDQRKNTNDWYQRNKEKHQKAVANNKARYRKEWAEFKKTLSCAICGFSHPAAIDFHHIIRDKEKKSINLLLANNSFKQVYEEVKKCIPLCSNCHRLLHWEEKEAKAAQRRKKAKSGAG